MHARLAQCKITYDFIFKCHLFPSVLCLIFKIYKKLIIIGILFSNYI